MPRYKLSLCHTPIKPNLLGFPGIGVFACGLLDHVFKRFASFGIRAWVHQSCYIFLFLVFFFIFHISFSLCCLCFGSDLVSNQFRSDCLLPTLFLISCVELSLLGLKTKGVILFFLSRISF
jgi:hypothetical protein